MVETAALAAPGPMDLVEQSAIWASVPWILASSRRIPRPEEPVGPGEPGEMALTLVEMAAPAESEATATAGRGIMWARGFSPTAHQPARPQLAATRGRGRANEPRRCASWGAMAETAETVTVATSTARAHRD